MLAVLGSAVVGVPVAYAATTANTQLTQSIAAGALNTSILEGSGAPVASPSFAMTAKTASTTPYRHQLVRLVHLCDLSWNQIVPSLRLMQSKLIDLGFEYYNGNVVINET
ncbi:hypothetical protein KC945_02740 [Candidatus Saccharibacteria bacterium]|nr:hypothetical protein [Candidatus Saccharibacteria bacterium]